MYRALTVTKADRNRVKPVFEKRLDVRAENFDAIRRRLACCGKLKRRILSVSQKTNWLTQ